MKMYMENYGFCHMHEFIKFMHIMHGFLIFSIIKIHDNV